MSSRKQLTVSADVMELLEEWKERYEGSRYTISWNQFLGMVVDEALDEDSPARKASVSQLAARVTALEARLDAKE